MAYWFTLRRKFQTWTSFSLLQQLLLLLALMLLPLIYASLQFWGFKVTRQWLARLPHRQYQTIVHPQQIRATVLVLKTAARYYQPWANCLKQSLVLWLLLRLQGIESSLQIGTKTENKQFTAHAWVVWQGHILNDAAEVSQTYLPFAHSFQLPLEAAKREHSR